MLRLIASRQCKGLPSRVHHYTTVLMPRRSRFDSNEWAIIEDRGGPAIILLFRKKGAVCSMGFPPEGMTAAEILAIPDAKKYWRTIAEVEKYLEFMAFLEKEEDEMWRHPSLYPDEN